MPNLSAPESGERCLRPGQVQSILSVAASTLWNYSKRGLIRPSHYTAGGHARYLESEVFKFKAELAQARPLTPIEAAA